MRIPLGVNLESRDGTRTKDAKVLNGIVEVRDPQNGDFRFRRRAGSADLGLVKAGIAQALISWNGLRTVQADYLNSGTFATITSPTSTSIGPDVASQPFSFNDNGANAATETLMLQNRFEAWSVDQAGAISSITLPATIGTRTFSVSSLTRSGTTATASIAESPPFDVGASVTIAGADQAAYNGAKTVTAIVSGTTTPAQDIGISITRSGTTATATTLDGTAHGLTNGSSYTISGANQSEYNGSKTITVGGDPTSFTFTVTVTAATAVTWNPSDKSANISLQGGNLDAYEGTAVTPLGAVRATASQSSGKWYWEVRATRSSSSDVLSFGVADSGMPLSDYVGQTASSWGYRSDGKKANGGTLSTYGASYGSTDVIGIALDLDNGTITFYKNGVSQGVAFTGVSGTLFPAASLIANGGFASSHAAANFGATSFTYTVPTGYYAFQSDSPLTPATGTIVVTKPAVTSASTFSFTVAGSPTTPATGTITASYPNKLVKGVVYLDGTFYIMDEAGVIYNTATLDDPTDWTDALGLITAQNENGRGRAIEKSGAYCIALKEWSTEFFVDNSNPTGSPLSPVDNGFTQVGCAHGESVAKLGDAMLWLSQTRTGGVGVHMMLGLQQKKVSTPDIDRILRRLGIATSWTVYAMGVTVYGHDLYILTLTDGAVTLVYDLTSDMWYEWTSYTIGSSVTVSTITVSGNTVTVTTSTAHGLADGDPVKISGVDQTEFNGIFQAMYVSSTVFKYWVESPSGAPTGTVTVYPYTESYFKFTQFVEHEGVPLFLHETSGHIYQMDAALFQDGSAPINVSTRTTRLDGGTSRPKNVGRCFLVGDEVTGGAFIRWSDDDCNTFAAYRRFNTGDERPAVRKLGSFHRRTFEVRHIGNNDTNWQALEPEVA